eukprot:scaffold9806_cov68-Phaeocystis_antarctica.AAC.2
MQPADSPPKAEVGPEWLVCNCRLRMHHAGSPPKRVVGSGPNGLFVIADCGCTMQAARPRGWLGPNGLFTIADCECSLQAARPRKGWGPNGSAANADCGYAMQAARPREGLGPEWLGCKCGLRIRHAGSPPKGRAWVADILLKP